MPEVKGKVIVFEDYPEFRPNLTPKQIFQLGSFGGTYWRPIYSSVTGRNYKNQHKKFTFLNIPDSKMTVPWNEYNKEINKYKVKVGQTLEQWEASGWITHHDPYGWVQWYCNFYNGRRCEDNEWQIKRWLGVAGPKGRFRKTLINKILKNKSAVNDYDISPSIRQTLQHWAYKLTPEDL